MNDTELENRIKKSAEDIQLKDFSARYANICEIADRGAATENVTILAEQRVTQTTAGNGGRRGVKIAAISAICAFAVVLAVILTAVFVYLSPRENTMDSSPLQNAEIYDYSTLADDDTAVSSGILADEFYSEFENAGIMVADFTIYSNITYSIYYTAGTTPIGGIVVFEVEQTEAEVEFFMAEYSADFSYDAEVIGVRYAIYGDLSDTLFQQIIDNLSE